MTKKFTIAIIVGVVILIVVAVLRVEPRVCRDFSRQKDAQELFNKDPERWAKFDRNNDNTPCQNRP